MRLMVHRSIPLTKSGREELSRELGYLQRIRQNILAEHPGRSDLRPARGRDVSPVKIELEAVEAEIRHLEQILAEATIVDDVEIVAVGCDVTFLGDQGEQTYHIGGPAWANPKASRVSFDSPLGKAALGHRRGERVTVDLAGTCEELRISAVAETQVTTGAEG